MFSIICNISSKTTEHDLSWLITNTNGITEGHGLDPGQKQRHAHWMSACADSYYIELRMRKLLKGTYVAGAR